MNFINFYKANCKNCYKCLRSCPVKAIKIRNEQAEIEQERCIACGHCLIVCPQNARYIKSDIENIKDAIKEGKRVVASIAPTFAGAFEMDEETKIVFALKKLGFSIVEETALGAEMVTKLYREYLKQNKTKNIITTCCPSVNFLIEKYFPILIEDMIPVVSPMLAHGKILKNTYGMDSYTVFIGPCTSKKYEAADFQNEGVIDAVLTFEELKHWFEEENIKLNEMETEEFDRQAHVVGRIYPLGGGVIDGLKDIDSIKSYEFYNVSGIDDCINIFNSVINGELQGVCIEANVCRGGCSGGPGMPQCSQGLFKIQKKIKDYIKKSDNKKKCKEAIECDGINFSKIFFNRSFEKKKASSEEIRKILESMGKYEKDDEMNCGVCGYNTCREKAQAVFEGMAETNMCLQYMRNKAESINYVVFENSPNIIIILDEELNVKEFNPAAEKLFKIETREIKDKPLSTFMDDEHFIKVKESKEGIYKHKVSYPEFGAILQLNILYVEKQNIILAIMSDITQEEINKKELARVKENTLDAAQEVIEKQMRVAQEIAGLLGETTAETKVILSKLKKIAIGENGD